MDENQSAFKEIRIVLCTAPNPDIAAEIATALVGKQLAACVNLVPQIRSIYRWEGKIEDAAETLMLIKTTQSCYPALQKAIQELHPYTVPEIIALPLAEGLQKYCSWVKTEACNT